MTIKIGINGFGRIGRLIFRAFLEKKPKNLEVIAINDLGSIESNAHLLNFDSTHGALNIKIKTNKNGFVIGSKQIKILSERMPENLPWKKLGVDVVLECTGLFTSKEKALKHIKAGAKKVIISAPAVNADATIVQGVNNKILKKNHQVVSNGSCTTNCLAPVAMILNNSLGIISGYMTTIHSFTGDQKVVDTLHSDLRRARTASESLIPTSTGAAKAIGIVVPSLAGKLDGTAIRVPTSNVSLIDFTFTSKKKTSTEEINNIILKASKTKEMKGILTTNKLPLVSKDFNHNSHSSIFDLTQTQVINSNFCRILSWYDNEWGFSNRMISTAIDIGKYV
ncbi:MAG: Glyceraldehyde-3-phosphate dehydrogenase [Alphaproteobacteria bacterium MarineAlpha5_Bin11]|nr:type I glyceraldehyde-3-phosphate dehydrogenase [Pelagibacteraceae bacterium]PPR43849.1 MAG: Glyceraldehyde-3-phosphate dehydrogenase [Alphaproteobacteria bacterium MarineAlpha5_Bin11]|tara:strand:- start:9434 stop:10444 length:1011 start_codon:yes stop_codon:yes gene_type:complete